MTDDSIALRPPANPRLESFFMSDRYAIRRKKSSRLADHRRWRLLFEQLEDRRLLAAADLDVSIVGMSKDGSNVFGQVRNNGPDPAENVEYQLVIPATFNFVTISGKPDGATCSFDQPSRQLRCALPLLPSGEFAQFSVDTVATENGLVEFFSSTSSSTPDPEPLNNSQPHPLFEVIGAKGVGNGPSCTIDTDGDALCDAWEKFGIDFDQDGTPDLMLPDADPMHKDLYVEFDWMDCAVSVCATGDTHSHKPVEGAMALVEQAFAKAPVTNPDNKDGIRLHIIPDEAIVEKDVINFVSRGPTNRDDFDDIKSGSNSDIERFRGTPCGTLPQDGHFGTVANRMATKPDGTSNCANVLAARRLAYRYAVFGHSYSETVGSSGRAEIGGNDFMVSLGG